MIWLVIKSPIRLQRIHHRIIQILPQKQKRNHKKYQRKIYSEKPQRTTIGLRYTVMRYEKTTNLLDNTIYQQSRFSTKKLN